MNLEAVAADMCSREGDKGDAPDWPHEPCRNGCGSGVGALAVALAAMVTVVFGVDRRMSSGGIAGAGTLMVAFGAMVGRLRQNRARFQRGLG